MSKKQFFIVLAILFLLQFGAVSFSFLSKKDDAAPQADLSGMNNALLDGLDTMLASITPGLKLDHPGTRCSSQSVQTRFTLDAETPSCTIELCSDCVNPVSGELDSARHRRGKLVIYDSDAIVFARVPFRPGQKPDNCIESFPQPFQQQKILTIDFQTNNSESEGENRNHCWLKSTGKSKSEITLSVQKGGAKLLLECFSCIAGGKLRLSIL